MREKVLEYVRWFVAEYGYAPTVREIGDGVGLTSTSTVHHHLVTLQSEGRIELSAGKARTIRVVSVPNQPPGHAFER